MAMRQKLAAVLCVLAFLVAARAQQAPAPAVGKVVREAWYERRTEQGKLGYLHLLATEVEVEGKKVIRTVLHDTMKYLRSGDPYSEENESYTVETPAGKVIEVGYVAALGKDQKLRVRGKPQGDSVVLHVLDKDGTHTVY